MAGGNPAGVGHGTHAFISTFSFITQLIGSQKVSEPEASSPDMFVVPAGHGSHVLPSTRSSVPQRTESQLVLPIDASSPAAFVVPAGHGSHMFD